MKDERFFRKRLFPAFFVLLCLFLVGGLCVGIVRLLLEQGQEVAVSVDTSGDEFTESVTITVRNVLGMDILIDERARSCAMLQYRDGDDWTDVCEIRFVQEDSIALSAKYGGMYAHLTPGGELQYQLDGEQLESLPGGEYRIAISYISENDYINYLHARAGEIEASLDAETSSDALPEESDPDTDDPADPPMDNSTDDAASEASAESEEDVSAGDTSEGGEEISAPKTQVLYKEFFIISRPDKNG